MTSLRWLPEAKSDIERLFRFLVAKDRRAAPRAMLAIQRGAKTLLDFPQSGRRMADESERRELFIPFGAGAYVIRYRVHQETIVVIRVWHSREYRA